MEKEQLGSILEKMITALKEKGIIYTSFKKGVKDEIKEGKYYNYLTKEKLEEIIEKYKLNVKIIDYFETLPSTKRIQDIVWANYILQKV